MSEKQGIFAGGVNNTPLLEDKYQELKARYTNNLQYYSENFK